jgi:ABC-type glutathione transport system ATPase component
VTTPRPQTTPEPGAVPGQDGDRPPIASARDITVTFRPRGAEPLTALDGVSIDIHPGQTLGLVGESGSGKTTLGRVLLGLVKPTTGTVTFNGRPITGPGAARRLKGRRQIVLQNPDHSLNPTLHVWRSVAEPLAVTGSTPRGDRRQAVADILTHVGLDPSLAGRYPHELSGGQRQRVAIARAIITHPDLIVFDEAVTALDVSVQTQVLNLIKDLQHKHRFAALFISHDIAAVRYIAHHIAVARHGKIVETGPTSHFYGTPEHPYTQQLLNAMPTLTRHMGRHTPPE